MASQGSYNLSSVARIKITPLKNTQNYPKWAADVQKELERLQVWEVVSGDIECPLRAKNDGETDNSHKFYVNTQKNNDEAYKMWKRWDEEASVKIYSLCHEDVQYGLRDITGSKARWDWLFAKYGLITDGNWWTLLIQMATHTLAGSQDCTEFVGKIRKDYGQLQRVGAGVPEWVACASILYNLTDTFSLFQMIELRATTLKDQTLDGLTARLLTEELRIKGQEQLFGLNAFRNKTAMNSSNKPVCQRCKDAGETNIRHTYGRCFYNDKYAGERPHWFIKKVKKQKGDVGDRNDTAENGDQEHNKLFINTMIHFKQSDSSSPSSNGRKLR